MVHLRLPLPPSSRNLAGCEGSITFLLPSQPCQRRSEVTPSPNEAVKPHLPRRRRLHIFLINLPSEAFKAGTANPQHRGHEWHGKPPCQTEKRIKSRAANGAKGRKQKCWGTGRGEQQTRWGQKTMRWGAESRAAHQMRGRNRQGVDQKAEQHLRWGQKARAWKAESRAVYQMGGRK